jgi:hypothetical protein
VDTNRRLVCQLSIVLLLVALLCASCGSPTEVTQTTGAPSTSGTTPTTAAPPGTTALPDTTEPPTTEVTPTTEVASDAGPLLSLLAQLPEDPISETEDFLYFTDYAAMASAYDAARPATAEEALDPSGADQAVQVWWAVFMNSAWSYSPYWQVAVETGPEMVGFSPLDVDQALQFGVPPSTGLMLAGSFIPDVVGAAYALNLELAPKEFDGATVWCYGDDPEAGTKIDVANRILENPFGGELGRRQPMTISEGLLMSSADLDLVLAHAGAAAGMLPSLADAPGYRAAVDAVGEGAEVLQAAIAGPAMALSIMSEPAAEGDGPAVPAYELLIAADVVTADEQIARVGLVYADAESAEAAGPLLVDRLAMNSLVSGQPYAELLTPPDGTGTRYHVWQGADQAVLVLEFPAPKAPAEEMVEMTADYAGAATRPGLIYRRILQMFMQRDAGWLSVGG